MFKLLKNCHVFSPKDIGNNDILIVGDKIHLIAPSLSEWERVSSIEVWDMANAVVCPGIVDTHVHIIGGGGELGPTSRTREIRLSELTLNGVTTVVSPLGTDGMARSLKSLLMKCRALEELNITCRMLTGSYCYPSPTVTNDIAEDIALINEIIGAKIAISDHRSSNIGWRELVHIGTQVHVSSMLAHKKGFVTIHVGSGKARLKPIFDAVNESDLPPSLFVPTHCCRTPELISDAVQHNKAGGTIDFTADLPESPCGTAAAVYSALEQGADPRRITMSSDSCGSLPVFDEAGNCISLTYSTPNTLLYELKRLNTKYGVPFESALSFFTSNPARTIGFDGKKGILAPGADADIMVLDDYTVSMLFSRGKLMVCDHKAVAKDFFEEA